MENQLTEVQFILLTQEHLERIERRDPKFRDADISCIRSIAQAAINVELFTIPLYMTSMYSIQGLHQINSKGTDFYKGRLLAGRHGSRS